MRYPPQKCSCCKKNIYHYDDREKERLPDECICSGRGEYYVKSGITSDSSGTAPFDFNDGGQLNYLITKIDQEHFN